MKTNATSSENYLLIAFLVITPLISLAIPAFLSLPAEVVPLILVIVPALLAILFTAMTEGRRGVGALLRQPFQWKIGFRWYFIALGLAVGLRLTMSVLALLLGWIPAIQLSDWTPPQYVIIGIFTLFGAFMEELGWRGYALPKLLHRRSTLGSALIIGIPWGILHLGLVLPGMMNEGTSWVATILFLVGLSVILAWFFVQTGYGIVAGIVYHAAQNYFVFFNGGITSAESLWLMTVVTLAIAVTLIVLYGPRLQQGSAKTAPMANAEPFETR
ncbi:MAG: hypothetical protein DCC56_14250 [Anaerolineae bacterium]|nr:hypothetical protein [Anaerolineales bacterium]RIK29020.1 MAG: hypothetical protein DCC56_14250 [Anaerolineae bacterium]WKZ44327.1 MAG: type II CAAX endopeptidase family protein [Anaerolineales bacterium]WKZ47050.1 MAG: type II CAAX endopeptidase family protein [Anaerolineales bacterium]